ncbi:MAG TPA: bifunctional acetate--CoA ligase family protein/GNAT family N-acetyltransferase [Sphingomonas sp.]|nr:bifunctional acetate--CoA ligase family protein/GNAT family N-acetyltransferase [Sphingomonas sp.]
MTIRNLEPLLQPRTVAVIGGSDRHGSLGAAILDNLLEGGFTGLIEAVNLHSMARPGVACATSIETLAQTPDLAIVATPAVTVPEIIDALGKRGCRVAVVISAGLHEDPALRQAMLDAAKPHLLRIVGPNCLGVLMPHIGLNASFAASPASPGRLALISQSGALVTAMLDWAADRQIGFSGIVSAGDMSDVDLGDLIDVFAGDHNTAAILLYSEGITNPAKFMSAARAAARDKPVIAIKAGRAEGAARAALSHTGSITGSYDVAAAAFRRAGIVLVDTLTELFDAAEVLSRCRAIGGNRIAIVSNGGGPAILAEDGLSGAGASLATLSAATCEQIEKITSRACDHSGPIDLGGDATSARFAEAVKAVSDDPGIDAVLAVHCPTAIVNGSEAAEALAKAIARPRIPVLACWLGPRHAGAARDAFRAADVPLFETVDGALGGIRSLLAARRAQAMLRRAPPQPKIAETDKTRARGMLMAARCDKRHVLSAVEAKSVLTAYGIPTAPAQFAQTAAAVETACANVVAPYVVKIVSPQISHKTEAGGVAVGLVSPAAARAAAEEMAARIARQHPDASIHGFEIEPMITPPHARELLVGIARDTTFGPYLVVGAGGTAVEVLRDRAIGLPPLDAVLAREMIDQTRISHLLAGYRDVPPAEIDAVIAVLEAVSALVIDFPEIAELDINPLVVDPRGVVALDARLRITDKPVAPVIRPVPIEWATDLQTRSGLGIHIRPVVPADAELLADFFHHVSTEDLRFRFLSAIREVGPERIAAMTQIDYRRTMTFLAFAGTTLVATAMLAADPDLSRAEVAISVHQDFKQRGISWTLLEHVLRYAKAQGIEAVESVESSANRAALSLEHEMGFAAVPDDDCRELTVRKWLTQDVAAA